MKRPHFRFWRWHVSVIALLVAFAVSVSTSTSALASSVPGEGNQWNAEYYDSGTGALRINTGETLSEAYNGSNLVQVWRGSDNNHVWFSVNHGQAFTLGNSATFVAPRIVAFGTGFAAFHAGVDGRIYWAILPYGNPGNPDNGDEPAIASLPNGNMQIAIRHHFDNSIYLGEMYNRGTSFLFSGWTQESQHWRSNYAPFLSAVGAAIYIIITGLDRTAYWKPSFR